MPITILNLNFIFSKPPIKKYINYTYSILKENNDKSQYLSQPKIKLINNFLLITLIGILLLFGLSILIILLPVKLVPSRTNQNLNLNSYKLSSQITN